MILYMTVGVPGSGKSTWIKNQILNDSYVIASTDKFVEEYAEEIGKTYSDVFQDYMPTAVNLMAAEVVDARDANKHIIWDQTSTTVASRAKKIRMLPEYYKIAVVFKTPPTAELQKRLERGGKIVPWGVVSKMAQQLENEPVTLDEGFNEIWYMDENGNLQGAE
jgi:predicted kinase